MSSSSFAVQDFFKSIRIEEPAYPKKPMKTDFIKKFIATNLPGTPAPSKRVYTATERKTIEENVKVEEEANIFTQYYAIASKKQETSKKPLSPVQKSLEKYTHALAIRFAATSHVWMIDNHHDKMPMLPRRQQVSIPSFQVTGDCFAFYRVVADRGNKYTLVACHVNVHGFHRGDLRFVEVTDRTVTMGAESHSVIGHLYLGDIVAVTELTKLSSEPFQTTDEKSIKKINQETKCVWAVKKMAVLTRTFSQNVNFAFLENGNAVVKGYEESMTVIPNQVDEQETDTLYIGKAFVPDISEFSFTADHHHVHKNALIAKSSALSQYPKAFGTIYSYQKSPEDTKLMEIGFDAYSQKLANIDSESVVETCALMGYSAANSIFNGRFDCRSFPMKHAKQDGQIVKFSIDNPIEQPTEGRWSCNTRIEMEVVCGGDFRRISGVIESVTVEGMNLQIVVRVARDAPKNIDFNEGIPIIRQRSPMQGSKLANGFFRKMKPESNGRRIIETIYGGPALQSEDLPQQQFYFDGMAMNQYQCQYVSMILNKTPLVLGSSPFGCGKSMTIVATALEVYKRDLDTSFKQLLITQSNYASVNLVEISKKIKDSDAKFVRYVSEANWKELPDNCRTSYDMPELMRDVFVKWATGGFSDADNKRMQGRHFVNIVYFVIKNNLVNSDGLIGMAAGVFEGLKSIKKPSQGNLVEAFFILYRPNVIMTTADSLQGLLRTNAFSGGVSTIQIDEASQLPEYTLISLLSSFPDACFGLIGDIRQLPPYCEDLLKGKLKDHGVGNTMERAVEEKMFPQAVLRYVYRCHPVTTQLLSDLFYDGQLISGVSENDRNQFITNRSDFWPNNKFPMIIVNNQEKARKMGTSWSNAEEARMVRKYVDLVTKSHNGYQLKAEQIGVISFYAAQTSVLTEALRDTGVKVGTVDAFQGTERDVVILCCTNEKLSEFMQLANRLNVAMSRARQATIVIGNVDGMRRANFWSTIVEETEKNGCLVEESIKEVEKSEQPSEEPENIMNCCGDDCTCPYCAIDRLGKRAQKKKFNKMLNQVGEQLHNMFLTCGKESKSPDLQTDDSESLLVEPEQSSDSKDTCTTEVDFKTDNTLESIDLQSSFVLSESEVSDFQNHSSEPQSPDPVSSDSGCSISSIALETNSISIDKLTEDSDKSTIVSYQVFDYTESAKINKKKVTKKVSCPPKPKPSSPALLAGEMISEHASNLFSQFYTNRRSAQKRKEEPVSDVDKELQKYKHSDAIDFAQASWDWRYRYQEQNERLPRHRTLDIPTSASESGIRAYYRVITAWNDTYILMACHVNVHGFHRRDLQFVVVNDWTLVKGLESHSVVGNLYLGDVVAVTGLARMALSDTDKDQLDSYKDACCWSVRHMTVLTRNIDKNVTFSLLPNGSAVVKRYSELMLLHPECKELIENNVDLYEGDAFVPHAIQYIFTEDHDKGKRDEIVARASRLPSYANAMATIFAVRDARAENAMFQIGWNAFSGQRDYAPAKVVEICALMGYSAACSVSEGRSDCRAFPMRNIVRQDLLSVEFVIDNPVDQPTEGYWTCNNRLRFNVPGDSVNGVIESVRVVEEGLWIVARLPRNISKEIRFNSPYCIVSQREMAKFTKLEDGFFENMSDSNGKRIIEALYGGARIPGPRELPVCRSRVRFEGRPLNRYQCAYVSLILSRTPIVLGSSPFGCGKSMTIVATALEVLKQDPKTIRSTQLLVTQNNYASVNLMHIAEKVKNTNAKFVRFITESNWNLLPDDCNTDYDMPVLMEPLFLRWATGEFENNVINRYLDYRHFYNMIYYLLSRGVNPNVFVGKADHVYNGLEIIKQPYTDYILEAFFYLYQPNIIITTSDSLQILTSANVLKDVSTIQIDEASQFPENGLISLLSSYPNACFGLFGDVKQLPPFCDDTLVGKLKEYGIGNTMERAMHHRMFPQATLRHVYRCHPVTTELLSRLFYNDQLISAVTVDERNEFITRRWDFWPDASFPIMIVNSTINGRSVGTSLINIPEVVLVRQIVNHLIEDFDGYHLQPEDIGVISFYAAQASILKDNFRGIGVKVGTVDAFQGTEQEVVILCCTNRNISGFMRLPNRLNVAMSRARQATIIVGNVDKMKRSRYWSTIAKEVVDNGCLADLRLHPFRTRFNERERNAINNRRN